MPLNYCDYVTETDFFSRRQGNQQACTVLMNEQTSTDNTFAVQLLYEREPFVYPLFENAEQWSRCMSLENKLSTKPCDYVVLEANRSESSTAADCGQISPLFWNVSACAHGLKCR